jgi:hypothetical protein
LIGAKAVQPSYEQTPWTEARASERFLTLSELASGTKYVVTVSAVLKRGSGVVVKTVNKDVTTTGPVTRILPPHILSVSATTTTITVKWSPGTNTTGVAVQNYQVEATGGVNNSLSSPWATLSSTARKFLITALTPDTRYRVHVDDFSAVGLPGTSVVITTRHVR